MPYSEPAAQYFTSSFANYVLVTTSEEAVAAADGEAFLHASFVNQRCYYLLKPRAFVEIEMLTVDTLLSYPQLYYGDVMGVMETI